MHTPNNLDELFGAFKKLRVLIIGDVMVDAYTWGQVSRISPEAPVPVVRVTDRDTRLGGAANVALNVLAMGATPFMCAVVGEDSYGEIFHRLMEKRSIAPDGLVKSNQRITTVKERVLAAHQHVVRVDHESDHPLAAEEQKALWKRIEAWLDDCHVVIFEDYDKGVLTPALIKKVISAASQKGIPTVVDPKKRNFMAYKGSTLFKPNLKEIKEGLKIDLDPKNPKALKSACDQLREKLAVERALITLSEHGVVISTDRTFDHIPAHRREIADVSGAGDTVVSIAGLAQALHLPPATIAAMANLAGGLVCEHLGVVPIDAHQLQQEMEKYKISIS